jgi:hypothetical protein
MEECEPLSQFFTNLSRLLSDQQFKMWRFIEPGPRLKFPLRESPFMQADPMYRDVVVAPPVRFAHATPHHPRSYTESFHDDDHSHNSSRSTEITLPRPPLDEDSI